jgi:hypothetical protein
MDPYWMAGAMLFVVGLIVGAGVGAFMTMGVSEDHDVR